MKRTTKALIALSVFAVFSGLTMPPRDAHADKWVIDGDTAFEALENNAEWNYFSSDKENGDSHVELKDKRSNNTVIFKNIKDSKGFGVAGGRGNGDTSNNTLIIDNSTITANWIEGGYSYNGNANDNIVVINNSTINAHVYGGDGHLKDAIGNKIIIAGNSDINGTIYGGYAMVPGNETGMGMPDSGKNWSGRADDNEIIIKKNTSENALEHARIYTGYVSITDDMVEYIKANNGVPDDMFRKENNTLTLEGWSGRVEAVRSTDNINFFDINLSNFVSDDPNIAKPILTITGDDVNDSFTNIIGTDATAYIGSKDINIGLSFEGGQDIKAGETIRLVQIGAGDATVDENKGKKIKLSNGGVSYAGVAQKVVGELSFDESNDDTNNKYIDYTVKSVDLNEQANVVNEGRAAAAAFLWQGDELISEALGQLNVEDKYGFETFAMVYGNDSRYGGTAHDLSINGWSGLVGVGSNNKTQAGDLAWAVYFENGYGNYDVTTSMNGISLDGDGSAVYNGGGIAARLTGDNGVYGEASLRAGLLKNDLDHGLQNQAGEAFGYESESNYYGFHLGVGKIFKLEDGASVDTYAKYYHSTVKDDSFTIDGDEFELGDIDSDRLRVGIRYNQGMDRTFNVYYGAAWEYEFNGDSNGYAEGHKLEETSLKGSTVIGELGVIYQPVNSPWSIDAKVKGYGGQRDGYSGSILATYHF